MCENDLCRGTLIFSHCISVMNLPVILLPHAKTPDSAINPDNEVVIGLHLTQSDVVTWEWQALMAYFQSDPIPALCDQALVFYSTLVQNQSQEEKSSQLSYSHAKRRNGNTSSGRERTLSDIFTYDFITILYPRLCAIVHLCKLRSLSCDLPILCKKQ